MYLDLSVWPSKLLRKFTVRFSFITFKDLCRAANGLSEKSEVFFVTTPPLVRPAQSENKDTEGRNIDEKEELSTHANVAFKTFYLCGRDLWCNCE